MKKIEEITFQAIIADMGKDRRIIEIPKALHSMIKDLEKSKVDVVVTVAK